MFGVSVGPLLDFAGRHPAVQSGAIILATFILEDAATVLAAMQAAAGAVSIRLALGSLYVGIVLGDLGLYGLGWLAALVPWIHRLLPPQRKAVVRAWLQGRVFKVVLVSRFLPGDAAADLHDLRLPRRDLPQVHPGRRDRDDVLDSVLFAVSLKIGHVLIDHFGAWRWAGMIGIIVVLGGRRPIRLRRSGRTPVRQ